MHLEEDEYTPGFQDILLQYLPLAGRLRVQDRLNNTSWLHTVAGELLARYSVGQYLGKPEQEISLVFGEKGKPHIENLRREDLALRWRQDGDPGVCDPQQGNKGKW